VRGIYTSSDDETLIGMHWDYLNELEGNMNLCGGFWVLARSSEDTPELDKAVDAQFRNSGVEMRTMPMKQWMLDMLAIVDNVALILAGISAAVSFAVLLILANTLAMSIRERVGELAVMRALGFRGSQVLAMVTAESLAVAFLGAALGFGCSYGVFCLIAGFRLGGPIPIYIQLDIAAVCFALGVALAISLASTLMSAYAASRVVISQALRYIG
jgi:putative ABC transport system permease protein